MATGSNTFKGLAVPLQGESNITQLAIGNDILTITAAASNTSDYLVCENSSGTENFFVQSTGNVRINATNTASHFCFDVRDTSTTTAAWAGGGNFEITATGTGTNTQLTALRACLNATGWGVGGGREAALNIYYKTSSSAAGSMRSYMSLDDGGTGAFALMVLLNATAGAGLWNGDGSCLIGTGTRALRFYVGTDIYYILCTSCTG